MNPGATALLGTEVVDVTLPTVTSSAGAAAGLVAVVAAAASLVLVALALVRLTRPAVGDDWVAGTWWLATLASLLEVVLLVADLLATDAVPGPGAAVIARRPVLVVVRLAALAMVAVVHRRRDLLSARERSLALGFLAVAVTSTVVLDSPRQGSLRAVIVNAGLAAAGIVLAAIVALLLHERRPDLRGRGAGALVPLVAVVALSWPLADPPTSTTLASRVVAFDDGTFDVTVTPAQPGPNAVHLYAFDEQRAPIPVSGGRLVPASGQPVRFLSAGTNHLIAYGVGLDEHRSWGLAIEVDTEDGRVLVAHTEIEAP